MREFTSISKITWALLGILIFFMAERSFAADPVTEVPNPSSRDNEDYEQTPFTDYGNFAEDEEEAKTAIFFQYGRFFGISAGVGIQQATGNRGKVYSGGFPMVDVRIHYWFDFNFAMNFQFTTSSFTSELFTSETDSKFFDVSLTYLGFDIKYYFNTYNLAAPLSFANPYLLIGAGSFSKTVTSPEDQTTEPDTDSKFGFAAGAGFEFLISPKTAYFYLEGRAQFVNFDDRLDTSYKAFNGVEDLTGFFYSVSGGVLFTW